MQAGTITSSRIIYASARPWTSCAVRTRPACQVLACHRCKPRQDTQASAKADIKLESDTAFAAKLLAISFGAGAILKYGSLAMSTPFNPDNLQAATIVILPVVGYTAWLLLKGKSAD